MCGCVCEGFVMCVCVCVCVRFVMCTCGFCDVWVCVYLGFVMCVCVDFVMCGFYNV